MNELSVEWSLILFNTFAMEFEWLHKQTRSASIQTVCHFQCGRKTCSSWICELKDLDSTFNDKYQWANQFTTIA